MNKKENSKKVAALGLAAVVLAGGIGAVAGAIVADDSKQVNELTELVEAKRADLLAQATLIEELQNQEPVVINNTVVETVEVEKEVLVDNENLSLVYKYVVDQEGDLTELDISEIDDNGVNELVNQIVFVNDIKSIAAQEVRAEIADLVDKEVVDSVSLDEDDVERVRVDDDFDEILVDDIDFEDKDASLLVSGSFEHDDIDYVFEVEVEFKDGALDDLSLVSLAKK